MENTLFIKQNYYACCAHETSKRLSILYSAFFEHRQPMSEIEVLQDMHANWKNHNKNQLQNGLTNLEQVSC